MSLLTLLGHFLSFVHCRDQRLFAHFKSLCKCLDIYCMYKFKVEFTVALSSLWFHKTLLTNTTSDREYFILKYGTKKNRSYRIVWNVNNFNSNQLFIIVMLTLVDKTFQFYAFRTLKCGFQLAFGYFRPIIVVE